VTGEGRRRSVARPPPTVGGKPLGDDDQRLSMLAIEFAIVSNDPPGWMRWLKLWVGSSGVTITDNVSAPTLPAGASFVTLQTSNYGEVFRGVSLALH
jgi:hypothetical protein